ncbi:MAG TPA: 2,4-dihydroxyhept-2-ene-1,7-dioic acid aldolase [Lachnospiraceae bacterium]|jgi:2-keto-3-deoxy-L-rhamnonate aldolase RhmA|nr:2,4-dihydroxyhept-2-ene-1,7-dioic acid aldolase [Lachnospiraceae bacterium]
MKENKLRNMLVNGQATVGTRIWSTWPTLTEACASTGSFDYIEFVAEYAPYDLLGLENLARACELHNISSMIKVDLQNRFYVAQRAMAAGFQSVLFTDHKTAEEVAESLRIVSPDCPESGGRFGYPNNRWVGFQPNNPQMKYAAMVKGTVKAFMIEKAETMDNIEEICSIDGVDMVQFGPSDYSMSKGWNLKDHRDEIRKAEEKMIQVALEHGVAPRCEIDTIEQAEYYKSLGVKHFCVGDEFRNQMAYWNGPAKQVKELAEGLK